MNGVADPGVMEIPAARKIVAVSTAPERRRKVNGTELLPLDGRRPCFPEQYEQPKGFTALLGIDDPVAERIFHALAENGTVQMPLQKTFWSVRFGALVDQFGILWAINCEQAPSVAGLQENAA